MNDPRARVYSFLESIEGDNSEQALGLKESLKAWSENEIQLKTTAIADRNKATEDLLELTGKVTTLEGKLSEKPKKEGKGEPSAELLEIRKQLDDMKTENETIKAEKVKAENDKFMGDVKSAFLKTANLKDDFAESKIDLAILQGNVKRADDGTTEIVMGDKKFTVEAYGKHLEENHTAQLKTVAGGKTENFSNEPAGTPDATAQIRKEITAGTNGLVQFRG